MPVLSDDIIHLIITASTLICLSIGYFMWDDYHRKPIRLRIARVTSRKAYGQSKAADALSLRRKNHNAGLPVISRLLSYLPTQAAVAARLEKAGLELSADIYVTASAGSAVVVGLMLFFIGRPPVLAVIAGFGLGIWLPHLVIGYLGKKRIKKFLTLFPDAIDFIVRGLRSGLPVTESMNIVGTEMEAPIGAIFFGVGESVRLGVTLEKALQDTGKKLGSTEFNFFVTSIVLQRETGGNLSEILNNLSDVLRKRFMMRMKIKAMSSEAKASAMIVGSLPFLVIVALMFISPGYLDPLVDDRTGNMYAAGAVASLMFGIGIMIKMTRFEI